MPSECGTHCLLASRGDPQLAQPADGYSVVAGAGNLKQVVKDSPLSYHGKEIGRVVTKEQILVPFPSLSLTQGDGIEPQSKRWCVSKLNGNVDIGDRGAEDNGSQDLREGSTQV